MFKRLRSFIQQTIIQEFRKIMEQTTNDVLDPVVQRFSDLYDQFSAAMATETTQLKALVAEMRQHTTGAVQIKSAGIDKLNAIADRFEARIKSIDQLSDSFSDSVEEVVATPPAEPAPTPTPVPEPVVDQPVTDGGASAPAPTVAEPTPTPTEAPAQPAEEVPPPAPADETQSGGDTNK
jgi:hypothetical protein